MEVGKILHAIRDVRCLNQSRMLLPALAEAQAQNHSRLVNSPYLPYSINNYFKLYNIVILAL